MIAGPKVKAPHSDAVSQPGLGGKLSGGPARLEVRDLSKSFGATRALTGVSMSIRPGEVHGLVGENGSGKSTLVRLLSGHLEPDPDGSLVIDGRAVDLPVRPATARECGLSVVQQDLGLIESFSVVENMRVGQLVARRFSRAIRWEHERELASASLAMLGSEIDASAPVAGLSAAARAEVAIARALGQHRQGRGLIAFDETSRALAPEQRGRFFVVVRAIVARGGSVLLVSHQLSEVLEYADRVTVLREGRVVVSGAPSAALTERQLIGSMVGRGLASPPRRVGGRVTPGQVAAEVRNVGGQQVECVSFTIGKGEVVGLTGLPGSGAEELPYLIAGALRAARGTLLIGDRELDLTAASPRRLLEAGVALVPERRDEEGLALTCSVLENVMLPHIGARGRITCAGRRWQRDEARRVARELGIRPADPRMPVGRLSAGNRQKVLLGRWLCAQPTLLVLHEPTQGVDVGGCRDVEGAIVRVARAGSAVLIASTDTGQLARVCDRVLVMRNGCIYLRLEDSWSERMVIDAVYGVGSGGRLA